MALVEFKVVGVAVDPPLIGAVAAANVDVAVPGVKAGDFVDFQAPDTLEAGLCPQGASCPADGTIRIRITNPSAAGIDGVSRLWNFIITRLGGPGGDGISWAG